MEHPGRERVDDELVEVTQTKLWSANGLAKLLDTITQVQNSYNPRLRVGGVVLNQHESRTVGGGHWASEIEAAAEARGLSLLWRSLDVQCGGR